MRSRAARVAATVFTLVALAALAAVLVTTEQRINQRRNGLRRFDLRAREAVGQLSDARASQQAYVAAGQSASYWTPKVQALIEGARQAVDELRGLAVTGDVRQVLFDVSASVSELGGIDKRAREYLASGQPLMASDVVFSEGAPVAAQAAQEVEATRQVERAGFDAWEREQRRVEMYGLAMAGSVTALALVLLTMAPVSRRTDAAEVETPLPAEPRVSDAERAAAAVVAADGRATAAARALTSAANTSTAFGRASSLAELQSALATAADAMDASGIVVWLSSAGGSELKPVLTHGYPESAVRLLRNVPREAGNAAAAAFRSGALQVVPARPGEFGAVVAPLVSSEGCVGALAAEIRHGAETEKTVQALAAIAAAHLTGVYLASAADSAPAPQSRTASA